MDSVNFLPLLDASSRDGTRAVLHGKGSVQLRLQQDLANTQEVALKLEAENKEVVRAMLHMRADFKGQQAREEQLATEKVVVRRENGILKETVLRLNSEVEYLEAGQTSESRPNQQVAITSCLDSIVFFYVSC